MLLLISLFLNETESLSILNSKTLMVLLLLAFMSIIFSYNLLRLSLKHNISLYV